MAPEALAQVLRPLLDSLQESERVVVGLGSPDDAVVYRMDNGSLLVVTTDFFAPVVDDAYTYGAIAAANAISDVYAMGGTPFLALNLAAFPADMPAEIGTAILRGGMEKAREAGVVVAGGHTMDDKEPKYGLVVLGTVTPERLLLKSGARAGERLVLTKPLGSGIITTALRADKAPRDLLDVVVPWMLRLNRDAVAAVHATASRAATDLTGFGFLGHAVEMALASSGPTGCRSWKRPARWPSSGSFPAGRQPTRCTTAGGSISPPLSQSRRQCSSTTPKPTAASWPPSRPGIWTALPRPAANSTSLSGRSATL